NLLGPTEASSRTASIGLMPSRGRWSKESSDRVSEAAVNVDTTHGPCQASRRDFIRPRGPRGCRRAFSGITDELASARFRAPGGVHSPPLEAFRLLDPVVATLSLAALLLHVPAAPSLDPGPSPACPSDMRLVVGAHFDEVQHLCTD